MVMLSTLLEISHLDSLQLFLDTTKCLSECLLNLNIHTHSHDKIAVFFSVLITWGRGPQARSPAKFLKYVQAVDSKIILGAIHKGRPHLRGEGGSSKADTC